MSETKKTKKTKTEHDSSDSEVFADLPPLLNLVNFDGRYQPYVISSSKNPLASLVSNMEVIPPHKVEEPEDLTQEDEEKKTDQLCKNCHKKKIRAFGLCFGCERESHKRTCLKCGNVDHLLGYSWCGKCEGEDSERLSNLIEECAQKIILNDN